MPRLSYTPNTKMSDTARAEFPFVHGKEIESFEELFLQDKKFYEDAGFDIRYTTKVEGIDTAAHEVVVADEGTVTYDRLVLGLGWNYADPGVPGSDLAGLHYVKNIRRAMEFDRVLDDAKVAVVVDASPIGIEMATAFAHRGLETHLCRPGWVAIVGIRRSGHHGAGRRVATRPGSQPPHADKR